MAAHPQTRLADAVVCLQESRILAAVVAKNAVGSSWRKTLGSREWSRVPEAEKAVVRRRAVACLLEDPSERVAIQARTHTILPPPFGTPAHPHQDPAGLIVVVIAF